MRYIPCEDIAFEESYLLDEVISETSDVAYEGIEEDLDT